MELMGKGAKSFTHQSLHNLNIQKKKGNHGWGQKNIGVRLMVWGTGKT